ncbi:hypothetical protein QJS10_CPA05g01260 [Acorus calamus]|uniref:DM2 domain-containing protein n=1 Tax=Acorus calamus TaxID=4465 RepID=A0AAV9EUW0_ACOCL|nr:hypothetical protein QJS10_CPA05g01260 [Acorus calamus]
MAFSLSCICPSIIVAGVGLAPRTPSIAPISVACGRSRGATVPCAALKPAAAGKREPRGITKPRPVSLAMEDFLGVSEIPRTQALKQIWAYIKEHNLQDPDNKKVIVCDEKLKNIFGGKERVGFLGISGLLNPHFMK